MKNTKNYFNSRKLFRSILQGSNFVTPYLIGYYGKPKKGLAIELSDGIGFNNDVIYGITVIKDFKHNHDLSKMFYDLKNAKNYINELKNDLN